MNHDEALALLNVASPATSDQIRRAYLRRVKVVRPERDPEGFKQLRAAYELLKAFPQPLWIEGDADDDGPAFESPAEAEVDSLRSSGDGPPLERDEPRDEDNEAAPEVEWVSDDGDADPDADPLVPDDEWPDFHIFEARRALERDDPQAAVASMERAVVAAEDTLRFGDPFALPRLWLTLADGDASTTAAPLMGRWLDVVSGSGALLEHRSGVMLVLVAELAGLWPEIPAEAGRAIAAGLLEVNLEEAMPALREFARQQPADSHALSNTMRERAPHLNEVYGTVLRAPDYAQGGAPSLSGGLPWWVYWIGLMLFFRLVSDCNDDDRRASVDDSWRIEHARKAQREALGQTGDEGADLGNGYEITDGGIVRVVRPSHAGGAGTRPTEGGAVGDSGDDR